MNINKLTASSIFSGLPPNMTYNTSSLFETMPASHSAYQVNLPVTASLMNYIPSSYGGSFPSFPEECEDEVNQEEEEISELSPEAELHNEFADERCEELWRAFRDAAGSWMSHRFTPSEWKTVRPKGILLKYEAGEDEAGFDGVLTKTIIAPHLFRLDRCPEFHYYNYTKCVLARKRLTDIEALKDYRYLQYVDVSSNRLTTLKPLGNLPFLKILDASHNLLTTILEFKAPYFLTNVILSHNKIKQMRDLSAFWSITDLNLSHNVIRVIDGIKELRYLTTLNLSYNRIETIENLGGLRIQFLYLQNNLIKLAEDDTRANFHTLKNIRTINLSYNQITSLKMFEMVENLESLDIVNNNIAKLLNIYHLRNLKYLNKLNLTGNPITNIYRYVDVCVIHIKNLVLLDAEPVNAESWEDHPSNKKSSYTQVAAHNRLKLLVLEQLNPPQLWNWLVPYDCPPLAVIVLVGLAGSGRFEIAKKFCSENKNVVVGVPYTTKPKHESEMDGNSFHYVDDETFMGMLKNGDFLTYQEHLGSYYGIAHSEFKKAENAILMFNTDLTMALALRRRSLNTVLVLGVLSTKQAFLKKLCSLYALRFVDNATFKLLNSPAMAAECQQQFAKRREELLATDAQAVLDDLLEHACRVSDGTLKLCKSPPIAASRPLSARQSDKLDKKEGLQLYWSSTTSNTLSLFIHPVPPSNCDSTSESRDSYNNLSEQSKVNLELAQNTTQIKKYISSMMNFINRTNQREKLLDQVECHDIWKDPVPRTIQTESNAGGGINEQMSIDLKGQNKEHFSNEKLVEDSSLIDLKRDQGYASCLPFVTKKIFLENNCYSDILLRDPSIKCFFEEELARQDELLELHLELPGLFRELIFTDQKEEALNKLKDLVKDITKYKETTKKAMLNFENDVNFSRLARIKIGNCFRELKKDVSISEKQAEEYKVKTQYFCQGNNFCENPQCARW